MFSINLIFLLQNLQSITYNIPEQKGLEMFLKVINEEPTYSYCLYDQSFSEYLEGTTKECEIFYNMPFFNWKSSLQYILIFITMT
jgi:hypothetical protein